MTANVVGLVEGRREGRRVALRKELDQSILLAAEEAFAANGFEGCAMATIAESAGMSKQNLMYYFPTKLALYRHVLGDVLADWSSRMRELALSDAPPAQALETYIRAKLEFSRSRPNGSRVFAMEVVGGARIFGQEIRRKIVPVLREDVDMLERWIKAGKARQVSAEHLFFAIWASTQAYADFAPQMLLLLNRKSLGDKDFELAHRTISDMVLRTLAL